MKCTEQLPPTGQRPAQQTAQHQRDSVGQYGTTDERSGTTLFNRKPPESMPPARFELARPDKGPTDFKSTEGVAQRLSGAADIVAAENRSASGAAISAAGPRAADGPAILKLKTPCWIWQRSVDQDGYGYFRRDRRHVRAHIHYYEQKHGATPTGTELDHLCRNRRCCNPDHLEPVTHIENCRRGGLVTSGMTIEKAREVRALRAQGVSYTDIAAQMSISKSLVGQIVTDRCWKDSPSPPLPEGTRHV